MDTFALNLKRRAEQLGISNAEVARRAGLSDRRYGNYVSGVREPDLSTLVRVADVLGISVDELLGVNATNNKVRTVEEQFQDRIAVALKALKCEDLQRVVLMIEALAFHPKQPA
ncbi:helix-turn-helix domain-containing protein [Ensifer sp. ENS11]|uniref:helix-turn-helix domain-containing protein n=1 Tax=Ensifer sp. ENS11 TaxID=2769291 RepID=UPI00177D1D56|nr:helix-turn-helix transcriptional regulator [Ensifer sp. ENS11]MBD9492206.1 helix-turn-helix transcriptional regulator [Ensifer sp. ENS11]MDP9635033.1 transcriptional regulator with XRE-family HTH domain [Ensifer adhaerens]